MKSPGIEVRPIKQISGASHFNEVFFTDVRIPDSQRLGAVGEGWKVSLTTLMNERYTIGGRARRRRGGHASSLPASSSSRTGRRSRTRPCATSWPTGTCSSQGLKYSHFRTMTALSRGADAGPGILDRQAGHRPKLQNMAAFAMDLMEQGGVLTDPELAPMAAVFQQTLMTSPALRIAGGSDEIMRNIIAERVLGLPPDVRVDKDLPFNELPTGKKK